MSPKNRPAFRLIKSIPKSVRFAQRKILLPNSRVSNDPSRRAFGKTDHSLKKSYMNKGIPTILVANMPRFPGYTLLG
jgi:hypothetical protein